MECLSRHARDNRTLQIITEKLQGGSFFKKGFKMFKDINDKIYQKIEGSRQGYDVIEYHIAYDLGSYNYWYSQSNARGFYLHAVPMKRHGVVQSYCLMGDEAGGKMKLIEVARKSKKAEAEAIAEANANLKDLGEIIAHKAGYTLGEFEQ